jgi:hypothetical protein
VASFKFLEWIFRKVMSSGTSKIKCITSGIEEVLGKPIPHPT